ncbi:MAG: glycyl-radical enzyme activating protein [Candidatus Lokiarchaeota archaeon]|nr:glycyl-radical enzyme activating protein [Candidatus Lokiarchaeota archaeon]
MDHKCIACKSCIDACTQGALFFEDDGLHIIREKCNSCGDCEEACPSTALTLVGKWWSSEDLFHDVEKEKIFFDKTKGGITVSGGEPTLQSEFLLDFLKLCKENGISTALDTCGYASQQIYEKLMPYVDIVLLDLKVFDSDKHEQFTGVPNQTILRNAEWISDYVNQHGKKIWIRTPLIPNYTATDDNVRKIGEFIVNNLKNIPEQWDLLSFNKMCEASYFRLGISWILKDEPLMTKEQMEHFQEVAQSTGAKNVKWSGLTKKEGTSLDEVEKEEKRLSAQDAFDHMAKVFKKDEALKLEEKVVMQYNVSGPGGGTWQLVLENGEYKISKGESIKEVSCTMSYDSLESFVGLRNGTLEPIQAFMSGKVKFSGNQAIIQEIGKIFPLGKGN